MNDNPLKVQETIAQQLMRVMFENITSLRIPWSVTPEATQEEILERMRKGIDDATRKAVHQILSNNIPCMEAQLKGIAAVDTIKATLIIPAQDGSLHALIDRRGSKVMIVLCDMEQYTAGMEVFKSTADQMPLISED